MKTKDAQRTKGTVQFLGEELCDATTSNGLEKTYYKEFKFGSIHGKVGDFVLVANEDSPFPDTVAGCDVAEILELYEASDRSEDPWRAVVRWFSRPHEVPKKLTGRLNLNKDYEIVQDNRDFDNDLSVETFFSICQVISADVDEDPAAIVKEHMMLSDKPTFVCRYKLTAGRKQKIKPYLQQRVNSPTLIHKSDRLCVTIERSQTPKQESKQKSGVESWNVKRISLPDSDRSRSVSPAIPLTEPSMRWYGVEDEKKGFEVKMLPVKSSRTPNKGNEQKTANDVSRIKKYSFVRKLKDEDIMKLLENDDDDDDDDSGHEQKPLITDSCSPSRKALKELGTSPNVLSSSKECSRSSIKMNQSAKKKLFQSELSSESSNVSEDLNSKPRRSVQETIYKPQGVPDEMVSSTSRRRKRESRDNDEGLLLKRLKRSDPLELMKRPSRTLKPAQKYTDKDWEVPELSPTRRKPPDLRSSHGTPLSVSSDSDEVSLLERLRRIDPSEPTKRSSRKLKPTQKYADEDWEIPILSPTKRKPADLRSSHGTPLSGKKCELANTPASKKGIRRSSVSSPGNVLQEARTRLHVAAVPKSLPCREREFENIYSFLRGKILDGTGGCMYISGVPGTGKTATVQEVVRALQDAAPHFQFIELNGMRLTEPRQAYVQLLKQLTGKTVVAEQAQQILEQRFSRHSTKHKTTLLLVDELDLLWTRRQDVVYNLLDWPTKPGSRLVVLTIANTMDLPERLLMGRVTSRLGLTRVTFHPYSYKQLQEIVMARLKGLEAFDPDAVQLVARKVAAVSGDARRALDICRRATEVAEKDNADGIVEMRHVDLALAEMVSSTKVQAIRFCSKMEQFFLQAVAAEIQRTGVEETVFNKVFFQLKTICTTINGCAAPSVSEALGLCARLGSCRLLLTEHSRADIYQRVLLNVSTDDIHYAMTVKSMV